MNASAAAADAAPADLARADRDTVTSPSQGILGIGMKRLAIYAAIGLGVLAAVAYGYHWFTLGRFIGEPSLILPQRSGDSVFRSFLLLRPEAATARTPVKALRLRSDPPGAASPRP